MAIIQVWSAPSCEAGAICYGALAPWVSASGSEATGTPAGFRVTVTRDVADAASLADGRCLRVLSQSRGEQWWFVSSVTDSDGDAALVTATAGPLRQLLTVRGLVRDGSTFAFTTGKVSVTALLNSYVLTNLSDDGLSWLTLGIQEFPDIIEVGSLARVTRATVLDLIERETGYTVQLRAVYSGSTLTGFAVDILADVGASMPLQPLSVGAQITQLQRTRDALRGATVVVPFDAAGLPMEQTAWLVDSTSGTTPAWIVLRDPVTGNPWPIRENDQLIGAYVLESDGTASEILDSRASDGAVQVAAVGSLSAGDVVSIVRDVDGRPVVELTSPSGVASSRGRLVGQAATKVTERRRNLVANGVFAAWTTDAALTGWTASGVKIGRYGRDAIAEETGLVTDGTLSSGASTITFRGGTPGQRLYRGEFFNLPAAGSLASYIATDVVVIDGDGKGSFTFMSPLGAAQTLSTGVADGSPLGHLRFVGGGAVSTQRPSILPDDTTTDLLRFTEQNASYTWYLESPSIGYLFSTDYPTVHIAAGVTMRSNGTWATTPQAVRARLRDLTAGTDLATAVCTVPVPSGTVHETITASATMSADTSLALRLFPGDVFIANDNIATRGFQAVRWVSVWVGDATPVMSAVPYSGSNALWHRAQDVLASLAQGTRYTVRGVDLALLQQEHGALALGQSVSLRSDLLDAPVTVRIVKLDYLFTEPEVLNLELGAITPRLTGVTVSL